jgi:hypothetical protein
MNKTHGNEGRFIQESVHMPDPLHTLRHTPFQSETPYQVLISVFPILVELLVQFLWQVDIRHDDGVEWGGSILLGLARVSAGVVLVYRAAAALPWLRAHHLGDVGLRGGTSWRSREMPSGKAKHAGHDRKENVKLGILLRSLLEGVLAGGIVGALGRGRSVEAGPCGAEAEWAGSPEGGATDYGGHGVLWGGQLVCCTAHFRAWSWTGKRWDDVG